MAIDWLGNGNDWIKQMEIEAEKIKIGQEVDKRLLVNIEYQNKLKDIDIMMGLLNKKRKELIDSKRKLLIEYSNKELENMGSKYRYPTEDTNGVFKLYKQSV